MGKKLGTETVTIIREPKVDRLDDAPVGPAPEHDIEGCAVTPRSSFEAERGWVTIEGWMVAAPYDADVLSTDKARYDGKVWEVEGAPGDYKSRRGKGKATIFYLRRQGT